METPAWFEPFKKIINKLFDAFFGEKPVENKQKVTKVPTLGDRGSDVTTLQLILNHNGADLVADGIFGPKTQDAVAAFQKKNGLPGSGIIGPKTMDLLGLELLPTVLTRKDEVYSTAVKEIGTKEVFGGKHNPRILEYHKTTGGFGDDETAWCASFVNWVLAQHNIKGTGSASARSFLKWGKKTTTPEQGDVVVFWRVSPTSWQGHVAFLDRIDGDKIWVLGGNQNNAVNIKAYPANQVLGFRTFV